MEKLDGAGEPVDDEGVVEVVRAAGANGISDRAA
jgi:hypothetical protein